MKRKPKKTQSFALFIKRIHSMHADGRSASSDVVTLLDDIAKHLVTRLGARAGEVMKLRKAKTLNAKCVQGALGVELGGPFFKTIDAAGQKAVITVAKAQEKA